MNKQPVKKPSPSLERPSDDSNTDAASETNKEQLLPAVAATAVSKVCPDEALTMADSELEETLKVLRVEVRRREREREASRPQAGSKVRILRGRPRYVGKVGTAVIVRRSGCFITVPDIASPAYVSISDLELLER